jgi:hypothetical protein
MESREKEPSMMSDDPPPPPPPQESVAVTGILADERAVLAPLASVLDEGRRAKLMATYPMVRSFTPGSRALLWQALDHGEFEPRVFEQEDLCEHLPTVARSSADAALRLYAAVLCLHSYAAGYHWDAANQWDRNALFGFATTAALDLPVPIRLCTASFYGWVADRQEREFTDPFFALASTTLALSAATDSLETTLDVARSLDDPGLASLARSPRWLLRTDLNGSDELESAWAMPYQSLLKNSARLHALTREFQRLWESG